MRTVCRVNILIDIAHTNKNSLGSSTVFKCKMVLVTIFVNCHLKKATQKSKEDESSLFVRKVDRRLLREVPLPREREQKH